MNELSRKWTYDHATAGLTSEAAAMAQGGFRLIGAASLMYISGVYWEVPKLKAADVAGRIHEICGALNYGRSSKYMLANAALKLARRLTKKWGPPDAAGERNIAWTMLREAESFSEAVDFIVSQIKADYGVTTLKDLYVALDGGKTPAQRAPQSLPGAFASAIGRTKATPGQITTAIITLVETHLGPDQINALIVACTAKIAKQVQQAA